MYAVIMAGGQGTRLWPLSRQNKPKQFHSFVGDKSLVRETYERLLPKFKPEEILISTTEEYAEEIKKHLPEVPERNIVIEPASMGSAPACGLVSAYLNKIDPDSKVVFLPADHMIRDNKLFTDTLKYGEKTLEKYPDYLVTIGINPTKADTTLGYIHMDSQIERDGEFSVFSVRNFVEKPDQKKAEEYLSSWDYLWNSGMFLWRTDTILELFRKFMPETAKHLDTIKAAFGTDDEKKIINQEYRSVEKTSVDYGILEKANKILVIPSEFGWSDIGSWGALLEFFGEMHGAKIITKGNHIGVDDKNCLVLAGDKMIATLGLEDIIVIDSPDAILVCDSKRSADLKVLLEKLKDEGKHLYL